MNTNQKGKLTELKILTKVIELGYSVSIPYGDKDRYDQIWDINGKLLRIQIKTCKPIDEICSGITFSCKSTCNGKAHSYTKNEIDYFATYWENEIYLVPVEECSSSKNLRFSISPNAIHSKNVSWAKDYLIEEVLQKIE